MADKLKCKDANQLDLVEFLETLGYSPQRIRGNDHWYLSPLRDEKNPSFKINRVKNVWYDHGTGEGGTLVDFGKRYYQCTIRELLERLSRFGGHSNSIQPLRHLSAGEKKALPDEKSKIKILNDSVIKNPMLNRYLADRKIPLAIAQAYCREITFELYDKRHLAIGFQNNGGGYELRNAYFKGSSSPKEPRLIRTDNEKELIVFEGFFSFLSYVTLQKHLNNELTNQQPSFLILNSLAFFEKSKDLMESFHSISLCLDRDIMGQSCTQKALQRSNKYKDLSEHYKQYKDLNEYLVRLESDTPKQRKSRGMRM
jgi:hypothetical protein